MSAVYQAIKNLSHVVRNLEGSVEQLEANLEGQQRDMFVAASKAKTPNSDQIVETLDRLIENAEKVLGDDLNESGEIVHG